MTWDDQPVQPAPPPAAPAPANTTEMAETPASGHSSLTGARRGLATLLLALGLLAVGGGAVAFAADPSTSPNPAATAQPSTGGSNGGSTAPSTNGQAPTGHTRGDCPGKGGSGSGSGSSPNASAAPSTTSPTTAPSAQL